MPASYRTLRSEVRHEIDKVKGSRFIATLAPVSTTEEVDAVVARVSKEFHDARHHCLAWRLGRDGARFRASDDGEPGGSAGKPMLAELEGAELVDVVAVVTRYFGGTKLGVGGLVRAYGGAVAEAIDCADIRTVIITRRVAVAYPYECTGAVEGLLSALDLRPAASDYGESVRLVFDLPIGEVTRFETELRDRTGGRAEFYADS